MLRDYVWQWRTTLSRPVSRFGGPWARSVRPDSPEALLHCPLVEVHLDRQHFAIKIIHHVEGTAWIEILYPFLPSEPSRSGPSSAFLLVDM